MESIIKYSSLKIALLSLILLSSVTCKDQRPFYVVGHQVNSIEEVKKFLDKGSIALESDLRFHSNGSVKEFHHGLPCECDRNCLHRAKVPDFLKHVRNLTDPETPGSYYKKMLLQFFDMKLADSNNKLESGRDLARHVLDYLWTSNGSRKQEVRVLLYFNEIDKSDVVVGFVDEFRRRGKEDRLVDVGFDAGLGDLASIRNVLTKIGVDKNVWLGDGAANCFNLVHPYKRLKLVLENRVSSKERFIDKVYAWTIDIEARMKKSLKLGVDAMITNLPEKLLAILQSTEFKADFRLGTIEDNPFAYYHPNDV